MNCFRINLYLTLKHFLLSFFIKGEKINKKICDFLKFQSKKKEVILTSQLRVGFILVLKYLKKKYPKKNQIILNSYNLAEMVNICKNLKLQIIFPNLNSNLFISDKNLKKKINNKTLAVVTTNIFNTYEDIKKVKRVCNNKKVPLIEDNAIYFGNFKKVKNKKIFSGSFGDFSLNSFNIMKNISAMYGGSVSTNDKNFIKFVNNEIINFRKFPYVIYFKQCIIFLILKILKIGFIYKLFFLNLIKYANKNQNKFILSLVYPSLKFKVQTFPGYYFSKISKLTKKMIFLQLNDKKNFENNHKAKMENNIYYYKKIKKIKSDNVQLMKYIDPTFQNFNDFPIIVKKKEKLVKFLFEKGIETKTIQYLDCQKIFKSKDSNINQKYEDKVLCLPNHKNIKKKYMDFVVKNLFKFYETA